MEAGVLCFQDLFDQPIHFVVPIFQRGYVWGQDANWAPLWTELLDAFHRTDESHFLGTLVLEQANVQTAATETRRVVDGQQRLTTVQVILAVMRDIALELDRPDLAARITTLTVNPRRTGVDEALKVWPSGADRQAFAAVITAGSRADLRERYPTHAPTIVKAYRYFHDRVQGLLRADPPDERPATLRRLVDAVTTGLTVIVLDLEPRDDPQSIFETLNAYGTPLRAGDLVRNHLFHECARIGLPVEDLYAQFWAQFDNQYWLARSADGPDKLSRMDAFLTDYLILERRRTPLSRRLFHEFQLYLRTFDGSVPEVMARMAKYARFYASLDTDDDLTPTDAGVVGRLRELRINVFRPVLIHLLANCDEASRHDALKALESYVIRRQIMRLPTRDYARLIPALLQRLDGDGSPSAAIVAELRSRGGDAHWPTDDEIVAFISDEPIFRTVPALIRTLLLLVEAQLRKPGAETITIDTDQLTIEHLMPRAVTLASRSILVSDPAESAKQEQDRRAVLHTLGNLTLVTEELNSRLGSRPWRIKQPLLLRHSMLNLNHALPRQWDVAAIRARSVQLARHLCAALPSPAALGQAGSVPMPPPADGPTPTNGTGGDRDVPDAREAASTPNPAV